MSDFTHKYKASKQRFFTLDEKLFVPTHKMNMLNQVMESTPFLMSKEYSCTRTAQSTRLSRTALTAHACSSDSKVYELLHKSLANPDDIVIEPRNIGLIPASEWTPRPVTLHQIHDSYFSKRNGSIRQFDIKLYNALCISKYASNAVDHIGVTWVDPYHFKVNEKVFSHFIGIMSSYSNLFDKQGPLETYGFEQVYRNSNPKFSQNYLCDDVDDCNVRLFKDPKQRFSRDKTYSCVE